MEQENESVIAEATEADNKANILAAAARSSSIIRCSLKRAITGGQVLFVVEGGD